MDFFCFSTCSFFFHFISFGLRPSGFGFDGFLDGFSTCSFFFHFIPFGLKPLGLGFDGFLLFLEFLLLFPFYCLWF